MNTFSQDTCVKTYSARQASARRQGFTLVEIMAATGIMVAVILLVLSLTGNVLNTWNFSSDRLAQNYEARIGLDFLNQDLEAAYFNSRGLAWMQVRYVSVGAEADFQTQLFFFSAVTDRDRTRAGDYCTVGYATAFQNPFDPNSNNANAPDGQKYGLYRKVVDAETTFDDVMSLNDFKDPNGGNNLYEDYWQGISGRGDGQLLNDENYLSANVVNFQVIFYYYNDDDDAIYAITSNNRASGTPWSFVVADGIYISQSPDGSSGYPAEPVDGHLVYADIKMTVLGDEGANMVDTGNWDDMSMDWEQFKNAYGQTFTRRVYIMSEPL